MANPSIIPRLVEVLEPYLEELQVAWEKGGRPAPTLPVTDGKVNVRQLVRALAGRNKDVRLHHEQHFFRKPELRAAVNAVAREQGLELIGSRSPEEGHEAARQRIGKMSGETSELRRVIAEHEAVVDALRQENAALREQMRLLRIPGW